MSCQVDRPNAGRDAFTLPFPKGRHGLTRLVWHERYEDIRDAIQRERNMKHWRRAWKARLILDMNPDWRDLYEELAR